MKLKLTALLLTSLATLPALAQETGGFEVTPDAVAQSLEFTGKPGKIATALVIRNEENPSLVILERDLNDVRNVAVIDNDQLGLNVMNIEVNPILSVSPRGSLLITQNENGIGRHRWERVLTVVYRDGKYVVAGFTYNAYDSLQEDEPESCDYNLLTGKGKKDGRAVRVKTKALGLASLVDDEKLYSCENW